MPKRTDLKKIMVIGSGPIIIGQGAEFDYAGTQACLALKEEGYEVVLCNSNPATIMTDTSIADKVYMEPLTLEYVAKIIRYERPDAIIPGLGGQTGLNLAMQLEKKGVLRECGTELLGTKSESIEQAKKLDEEILSVWTGTPHLRVIDNSTSFDKKLERLMTEILSFLGIPKHFEIERKFLIEYPDLNFLNNIKTCRKIPLTQAYLTTPDEGYFRISSFCSFADMSEAIKRLCNLL